MLLFREFCDLSKLAKITDTSRKYTIFNKQYYSIYSASTNAKIKGAKIIP